MYIVEEYNGVLLSIIMSNKSIMVFVIMGVFRRNTIVVCLRLIVIGDLRP